MRHRSLIHGISVDCGTCGIALDGFVFPGGRCGHDMSAGCWYVQVWCRVVWASGVFHVASCGILQTPLTLRGRAQRAVLVRKHVELAGGECLGHVDGGSALGNRSECTCAIGPSFHAEPGWADTRLLRSCQNAVRRFFFKQTLCDMWLCWYSSRCEVFSSYAVCLVQYDAVGLRCSWWRRWRHGERKGRYSQTHWTESAMHWCSTASGFAKKSDCTSTLLSSIMLTSHVWDVSLNWLDREPGMLGSNPSSNSGQGSDHSFFKWVWPRVAAFGASACTAIFAPNRVPSCLQKTSLVS